LIIRKTEGRASLAPELAMDESPAEAEVIAIPEKLRQVLPHSRARSRIELDLRAARDE
jgi:hypothetical protein